MSQTPLQKSLYTSIEVTIRLLFLFILIAWCLKILLPFTGIMLWAIIIAVSIEPIYNGLLRKFGDKPGWASTVLIIIFLIIIVVPAYFGVNALVSHMNEIRDSLQQETINIPPPNKQVASWPVIGEKIYTAWAAASENLENFLSIHTAEVKKVGKWLMASVLGISTDVLQIIVSFIIAGVLLATRGTNDFTRQLFRKLVGKRGDEFADLCDKTVKNVTKGILGVAVIQSFLLGILFFLAGVPYAAIWALIAMFLGIIQLPPTIISIPVIVYLYSSTSATMATVWAVLILLASISDNVLKPILLGKGAPVPMLIIFLGAIGGFILSGFIGLFTGAIVLSLGYELFMAWLQDDSQASEATSTLE
ncbi:MAG: AI-2E family transporter [Cyclobacteriaceae bacterium]|nr:MAG: AI-2E family transporter [Cyclobacteriaceae bacterium]